MVWKYNRSNHNNAIIEDEEEHEDETYATFLFRPRYLTAFEQRLLI